MSRPNLKKVQFYNHVGEDGSHNLTVLFDSAAALKNFQTCLEKNLPSTRLTENDLLTTSAPLLSLCHVLFSIHQQMNDETLGFVGKVFGQATDIVGLHLSMR